MRRVFISFRIEDKPQVNGLRLLAANSNYGLEFYDESVRSPFNSTTEPRSSVDARLRPTPVVSDSELVVWVIVRRVRLSPDQPRSA